MLNPHLQRQGRAVYAALAPVRQWHHDQVVACQTAQGSLDWHALQASGAFLVPLRDTFAVCQDL
eukprot:6691078-Lingulodinium_polyedra.AAC.1